MQRFALFICLFCLSPVSAAQGMRIVSSGASVTEILFALNRGDRIIATDSTSNYPASAAALPKLGYFRQLSTEGVLAQDPTHLLGAAATGPDSAMQQLTAAGVTVKTYQQPRTIEGLYSLITAIGDDVDASSQASELIRQIKQAVQAALNSTPAAQAKGSKALYIVANSDRGLTVAGAGTLPDALFSTLGIANIASDLREYKLMSNESVMQANPDIVFVASHFGADPTAVKALCSHPAIAMTSAGKHCAVKPLSSALTLGLSPRVAVALSQIAQATAETEQVTGE